MADIADYNSASDPPGDPQRWDRGRDVQYAQPIEPVRTVPHTEGIKAQSAAPARRARQRSQAAEPGSSSEALREREGSFRLLFASNPLPMWLYDLDTLQFIEVNQAAIAHYGYSREEFLGMRITDIRPPADVPLLLENVAAARPTLQQARRWRHLKKGGQVMEVQVTSHTLEFDGHRAALVVAEDITERKVAEELAQRQIARLAALRSIDVAITASLDLRGTLNVLLEQVTAQLGVHAADVLLLHPHSHVLEYAAGRGFLVTTRARTQVRVGEGYAGRAALERRIIGIPNINDVSSLAGQPILSHETFSAYYAVPLVAKGRVQGVLEVFHRAPLAPDADWLDFLEALAGQAAIAIDNAWLFDGLQRSNMELALAYDTTLEGWSRALDLRDKETEGHTQRVTEMTVEIARTMGMDEAELVHVRRGALLHDIGKMGIPDSILLKPGPLTDEEWVIMRQHPVYAYELLSPISFLRPALDIPYCHHEKWDGTGYPNGLKGTQIPLAARLFAVVDVWDALCSDRPYRPAWSEDKARDYLTDLAGVQFEAQAVDALFALV